MDPLTFIVVLFLIVVFLALLPLASGIGSYKLQRPRGSNHKDKDEDVSQDDISAQYQGYVPLEEKLRQEQNQKSKGSKLDKLKNLKVTRENMPVTFQTSTSSIGQSKEQATKLRNRKARALDSLNNDPDSYDYDLDDLINEIDEEDQHDKKHEFESVKAKSQSDLEDLT